MMMGTFFSVLLSSRTPGGAITITKYDNIIFNRKKKNNKNGAKRDDTYENDFSPSNNIIFFLVNTIGI